jgi:hypothetical protein
MRSGLAVERIGAPVLAGCQTMAQLSKVEMADPKARVLLELLPWVKQCHHDFNPETGMAFDDYTDGFLREEAHEFGLIAEGLNQKRLGVA